MALLDINKLKDSLKLGKGKKETFLLVILIFVFILIAYCYVFFKPAVGRLMGLSRRVSNLNMELKQALSDIANRPAIEKKKTELKTKIDEYEKRLPTQKEIPKLLEDLSEMAAQAGVKIIGIMPVETGMEDGLKEDVYRELPIKINAKCGYHQLGRFIHELETADRLMRISDISIEADPSAVTKHRVKLLLTTYTLTKER